MTTNLDQLLKNAIAGKKIVIFGTGSGADKAIKTFDQFDYYVDNNAEKHGQTKNGRPILPPKTLHGEDKDRLLVIVASSFYNEISTQLESYGLTEGVHFWDGFRPYRFLHHERFKDGLTVENIYFSDFATNEYGTHSVGFHRNYIIKIEHERLAFKDHGLLEEIRFIRHLNAASCVSCPELIATGQLDTGEPYYIQRRVYGKGRPSSADFLFALLEQKYLGVYQGDLKPENIIFDGEVCYLVDYDQAVISDDLIPMSNRDFLQFIMDHSVSKYTENRLTRFNNYFDLDELRFLLKDQSFNLAKTTLVRNQMTTQEVDGIYHQLFTDKVYINGARDFSERMPVLNQIPFAQGEQVLDVGCNMGLLSHYLFDRNCEVVGIDLDASIIKLAQMVANILGKRIVFRHADIDHAVLDRRFDTICFFSVLQHVENIRVVGKTVAEKCNRIIIENRLSESGRKLVNGLWKRTTSWYFEDLNEMARFFEDVFPGFVFHKCYGHADRSRYILEFVRKA